jgi:HTH-type transcriptional regulator / antitoxin HigA
MINRPSAPKLNTRQLSFKLNGTSFASRRRARPKPDRFELLALLIEAYEDQHHPIGPPHPVEMIRHRMRTAGYTQADLAALLGSRARASEVLAKKRRLTLPMIWKFSREWKILADTLVEPYRLSSKRHQRRAAGTAKRKAA